MRTIPVERIPFAMETEERVVDGSSSQNFFFVNKHASVLEGLGDPPLLKMPTKSYGADLHVDPNVELLKIVHIAVAESPFS